MASLTTPGSLPPSASGRKGSIIAHQYETGERVVKEEVGAVDMYPANEEIAKAVQQKVAAAVEMARKYRHVGWYATFVAAYMIILYFQASAYQSGDVVQTLKQAFLPEDGSTHMTFRSGDELLEFLGSKVLLPIWQDPVCGDGTCQQPWEFPAWGRFGCRADCGVNENTTAIALSINADFTRHPTISSRTLMSAVRYNLCLKDQARRNRGEADLCWFEQDLGFQDTQPQVLHRAEVVNGQWYVSVKGDFTGRVEGKVYDISAAEKSNRGSGSASRRRGLKQDSNETSDEQGPVELKTEPEFKACTAENSGSSASTSSSPTVRRLMEANDRAREVGGAKGLEMMKETVEEARELLKQQKKILEERNKELASKKKSPSKGKKGR